MPTPTIVKIRQLKNVGVLEDVAVDAFPLNFLRYNVVYGFNGTGKTTLCRLIESISDAGLNPNLPDDAVFSFELSDGSKPSNAAPANAASRYIAVFSEDFVERSLAWKSGAAQPIIFLGEEQAELAKSLEELELQEREVAPEQAHRAAEWSGTQRAIEVHCRDTARLISEELGLGRRYNAANLKDDYADTSLSLADKKSEQERAALKEIIWRTDVPSKIGAISYLPASALEAEVADLLATTVEQITIEALERRKDALPWVKRGLELHDNEAECLFCGNELTRERKASLADALSGGFERLATDVNEAIARVREFRDRCESQLANLKAVQEPVPELREALRSNLSDVQNLLERGQSAAREWLAALQRKAENPGSTPAVGTNLRSDGWDASQADAVHAVNETVATHNERVDNFETEKREAASKLKRHFLHESLTSYHDLCAKDSEAKIALDEVDQKLAKIRLEVANTRSQLKAHGPAAKQLNKLLKSYLGHDKITLAPTEEGYEICRDGKPSTKPLSEGEKTAVAFCYFITSLTAEGRKIEDMIVVVDDPISSLDTRAMSYVVAMMRLRFMKCTQLFVLTHNLDFMREMKKWLNKKRSVGEAAFLFVETRIHADESRSSKIVEMPALIREYESEYHYLFSLVCMLVADPAEAGGFLYLMPNAIRKVLETFLAFKQPGFADLEGLEKILALHPNVDGERVKAMELLIQAESHSQNIGDSVSFSAYTLEQIREAGKTLLDLIEVADKPHFDRMKKLCKA